MEKEIHTYTITLYGPGYQYVFGKLPERIWQYIQTECGGNAPAYLEKWGEDLPEDMQLSEGFPNVCNAFFAEERRSHGFLCYEASGCAGMDGAQIEVRDEDGNLVYSTEFMKDGSGYSPFPKDGKTPTICRSSDYPPSGNYRYFLFLETYEGQWMEEEVEDYEFDPSKLILKTYKSNYDHFRQGIEMLDEIWYGDQGLYRIDGTESPDDVFGGPERFEIFDATPLSDEEMAKVIDTVDLPGCDWVPLLRRQPQFVYKCDKWAEMSGGDAASQLNAMSQFPDNGYWNGKDWDSLLSKLPEFADKFDWSKLDGRQWALLLAGHPQFADKCDCWGKFDDWDWGNLLKAQPQLAKYKPER